MSVCKRVPHLVLKGFVKEVLAEVDADNNQGEIFTDALLWSDLIGRPTHGIWRLPAYVGRIGSGSIKCPCEPRFQGQHGATDIMDGDAGIGHYVGHAAMLHAIDRARSHGIGAVGVHNSNHFGAGSYFVQLAAKHDMVGVAMSNSLAKVAPHGGVKGIFGTNPFAFSAPCHDGNSMLLDMTTAAISGSQVMRYIEDGRTLPPGVAIGHDGKAIQDPRDIARGALQSFGGARGSGIALMVEILCSVLSGAMFSSNVNSMFSADSGPGKNGHFFIAVDIGHFLDIDIFKARLKTLFDQVRNSGVNPGDVLIPGDVRWHEYHRNLESGVPLDPPTVKALEKLAADMGLPGIAAGSLSRRTGRAGVEHAGS